MVRMFAVLAILMACCLGAAHAAADNPFPLGVYWPWERVCGNAGPGSVSAATRGG
jgi:hypothetical protein